MKILAIDDVRDFPQAWITARTYKMGLRCLRDMGPWDELRLDHDLGAVHMSYNDTGKEMTGYDICLFLEENLDHRPRVIVLVTSNPVGKKKMETSLASMGYEQARTGGDLWELEKE